MIRELNEKEKVVAHYLKCTYKPTFSGFTFKCKEQIKSLSADISCKTALSLQKSWCSIYNNVLKVDRPSVKLSSVSPQLNDTYSSLFQYVRVLNLAEETFELSAIKSTTSYATRATNLIKRRALRLAEPTPTIENESILLSTTENEPIPSTYKDPALTTTDNELTPIPTGCVESSSISDSESIIENKNIATESNTSSFRVTITSQADEFSKEDEMYKLLSSDCLNMMNETCRSYYSTIFSRDQYEAILIKCKKMRQMKHSKGDHLINEVFNSLLPCRFDRSINQALTALDDMKSLEKDKKSLKYLVLCIVYNVVNNFKRWTDEDQYNETMYMRKFEDILEFLFIDTGLTARDGEGVSQSTRRMQILNDYNITYGRRIDLLVSGDNNEISSIEFKKRTISNNVSLYQQSKNIRINSCILSHIHLMTSSTEDTVLYYDFIGRDGYLCQLFEFEGAYICQKIQDISIPKCLLELDSFRSSLKNLFAWKEHLVNLSNMISLANYNQEKQYRLVDICSTISPPRSPSRSITPANVYLSPSKANKRTRNIIEHDDEN